jgi:hypothetical protein
MTSEFLVALTRRYEAYVDTYRTADGALPQMVQLKLDHTRHVVEDAKRIMEGERWPVSLRTLGEACALLHDAGRYSQLKEFGTFQDTRSIDHAARGVEVITAQKWLAELPPDERGLVIAAVAVHNRKEIPAGFSADGLALAHLVRDADKLDIFRVLEEAINDGSLGRNPEIAWDLAMTGAPAPEVVSAVSQGQPVSYAWIKNLSDFVLIQVGWLIGGLHYDTSLRLAVERSVLEFRERYLAAIGGGTGAALCCEAARAYLDKRLPEIVSAQKK